MVDYGRHGKKGEFIDFDKLKAYLEGINDAAEVKKACEECLKEFSRMSEKQRNAVKKIFATRIEHIECGDELEK